MLPRTCLTAAIALLACGCANAASADRNPVAVIGKEQVLYKELTSRLKDMIAAQEQEYSVAQQRLAEKHDHQRHDFMESELGKLLDDRAVALEAESRQSTADAVLAEVKVPAVTDAEARAFYESRKSLTEQPYAQLADQIKQRLDLERNDQARREFLDGLRAKYHITSLLPPYRVNVAATGPSRGNTSAPVTIIEFGDFQCPFCAQAEATLKAVLALHPDDVRLVFRQYPLTEIHPLAQSAALASVCAGRQGRFWEMHDTLYADQKLLPAPALLEAAKGLGIDTEKLSQCVTDPATAATIAADRKAGDIAGITGTPTFFVNGRPVYGNIPAATFESVIADELGRLRPVH
jgi:protein-disulfide isomerase